MLIKPLPDPRAAAQAELDQIKDIHDRSDRAVTRVLADRPYLDRETVMRGVLAFHRERFERVPDKARFPEAQPWVDFTIARDRELQQLSGASEQEMAIVRSLLPYNTYRGHLPMAAPTVERCRVAVVPHTDRGAMHIKNVDDPLEGFIPRPPLAPLDRDKQPPIVLDGVGSGLLIDDEPDEIFPLDARSIVLHHADDLTGVVEFLTRYKSFWHSCNVIYRDRQSNSVAIEKCSANGMEVYEPDENGISIISGMTCRDKTSPLGQHQQAKRDEAAELFGLADDGSDRAFWALTYSFHQKLADEVATWDRGVPAERVWSFFSTDQPNGLCKTGEKFHPDQAVLGYTLITHAQLLDDGVQWRIQRDPATGKMPTDREEVGPA